MSQAGIPESIEGRWNDLGFFIGSLREHKRLFNESLFIESLESRDARNNQATLLTSRLDEGINQVLQLLQEHLKLSGKMDSKVKPGLKMFDLAKEEFGIQLIGELKQIWQARGELTHNYSFSDYSKVWRAIRNFDKYADVFMVKYRDVIKAQYGWELPDLGIKAVDTLNPTGEPEATI